MSKKSCRWLTIIALWVVILSLSPSIAQAIPAYPGDIQISQPNGTTFEAKQNGDEWENWTTLTDDNSVIVQDEDGYWKYAEVSFGQLQPTDAKVEIDLAPEDTVKGEAWQSQLSELSEGAKVPKFYYDSGGPSMAVPLEPTGGPQKVLVLLVGFTDRAIINSDSVWSNTFFGDSGDTVKNYFKENSYNNFYFTPATESSGTANDGVVKVTLNYNHPNPGAATGDANRLIVKNALIAADPYVNYASYDTNGNGYIENFELHIVTIVAGYDRSYDATGPSVWGHRWSFWGSVPAPQLDSKFLGAAGYGGYTQQGENHGNHRATIGILCHELAHDLGTVDLYNTDTGTSVVGVSSLMDVGSWGMGPGDYPGGSPAHLDPWHKQFLGFATATVVTGGTHNLNVSSTGSYNMLRYNTSDANQYFMIENRNRTGFDDGLYYDGIFNGGIAIWHIEENIIQTYMNSNDVNSNGHNPGVWLEKSVSWSDPYFRSGGPKNSFGDLTTPNSKLYSGQGSGLELTVLDASANTMRVQLGAGASIQFNPTSYTLYEGGGTVNLAVYRTGDTTGTTMVDYSTANGSAMSGTDYTGVNGTLTFAPGESNKIISVNILDDTSIELDEVFTVNLFNPSGGTIGASSATVTIRENDSRVSFNPTTYTVSEAGMNATLTVTRIGATSITATVDYATTDGTAVAGSDYTTTTGTLTFTAGQTSKTISVPISDDSTYELDESFTVVLTNGTNGATVGSGTATVTISANDEPFIGFNPTSYTSSENSGSVVLTVTRTGDSSLVSSVNYATVNGTAVAGSDYTATSGTLTFAGGETSKTISVPVLDDGIAEGTESFTIQISNPTGGATLGTSSASVVITDDDGGSGTVVKLEYGGGAFAAVGSGQSTTVILNGVLDNGGIQDVTALATWVSSNPEVATVSGGTITGMGTGTTVITGTYNGISKNLTVIVR